MTIFKRDIEEEPLTSVHQPLLFKKNKLHYFCDFSQIVRSMKCSELLLEMWKVREYIIGGFLLVIPPCTCLKRYQQQSVWNCDSHCLLVFSYTCVFFRWERSRAWQVVLTWVCACVAVTRYTNTKRDKYNYIIYCPTSTFPLWN